jgi:anti-sigma factor RsiW
MKELTEHVPLGKIQQYVDGALAETDRRAVTLHLDACRTCRAAWVGFSRLDGSLKRMPREHASPSLAATVMNRLNITPPRDSAYALLKHTGTVFAFLVVAAILIGVFLWTGVITLGGGETDPGITGWFAAAGDTFAGAADGAGTLTARFVSFFSSQGGSAVVVFGVAVLGFLGVADFLFRKGSLRH